MSTIDDLVNDKRTDGLVSLDDTSVTSEDDYDLPQLQPLSHDNPYLSTTNFNVEDFLLSRSHTSLPDLRSELREYLAALKEELVGLINDDYEAFISLSTDLQEEGDRLERMKLPSAEMNSIILEARTGLQSMRDSIKEKLDRRSALREEKALLHLLLKISDAIARLESLLHIASPSDGLSLEEDRLPTRSLRLDDEHDEKEKASRSKELLRIATEYNHLLYLSDKAGDCAFVIETQWRIKRIKSTLASDLEGSLKSILNSLTGANPTTSKATKFQEPRQNAHVSELNDTLRTYDMLCLWRDAEDIIRHETIREFLKKVNIFPGSLSAFSSGQDVPKAIGKTESVLMINNDSPLAMLFNKVLLFLSGDPKLIMDIAEQVSSMTAQKLRLQDAENIDDAMEDNKFDILANVLWAEISRAVTDELGSSVFAVGKPDDFRENFQITQQFITALERLAPSPLSVKRLRHHPSFNTFQRRWQLPVYFQLRWKDIVTKVEDALENKPLTTLSNTDSKSEGPAFRLSQSATIWEAVCQCWKEDIYLSELGYRFWKLTLQLVKRYQKWLEEAQPAPKTLSQMKSPVVDKASGLATGSRSTTPVPILEAPSSEQTQDDDRYLQQCSVVIQDIKVMESAIHALYGKKISILLPRLTPNGEVMESLEDSLNSCLKPLSHLGPPLLSQVEAILVQRCCEALAPVKSLPGQFRSASQRTVPSKPSTYVPLILRPVKSFFGMNTGEIEMKALKEAFCALLSSSIVESVAQKYSSHISGMRKTEESLKRLRMGRRTGFSLFGGSGGNADDDGRDDGRVRAQLILDVEAFSKEAGLLGVDYGQSAALKALNYMVHSNIPEQDVS